jgi:hypothetical protein
MRTYEGFLTLIQELSGDLKEIQRLQDQNSRAWKKIREGADDVLDYGALAYTIHTIYGVMENYFLRISKFFENSLPGESWHKTLVDRMALDIPEVRPAFIPDMPTKKKIRTLLQFRHMFRNLYGEDLHPDKTAEVQRTLIEVLHVFPDLHRDFCRKLSRIAEKL